MPTTRTRARRCIAVLTITAVSLGACGDDDGSDDAADGDVSAFCAATTELDDVSLAGVELGDPEALSAALQEARGDLDELLDAAPDDPELTEPLDDARSANIELGELLEGIDLADPDAFANLIGDLQAHSDELTDATQSVQAWIAEHCDDAG